MANLNTKTDDYDGELDTEFDDYDVGLDAETDDYDVESDTKTDDVRERLQRAWASEDIHETCGILVADVSPRCMRWLLNRFESISEEDAEDCFNAAIEGVLKRGPGKVRDVYNYAFTSAKNRALDLVREREHFIRFDPELIEGASDYRLRVIAEAALDEEITVTVREDHLKHLFALVFPKLPKNRRRLAELLLRDGAVSSNEELAREMEVSKDALKSLKSRTLSDLRRLLPIAAEDLGIDFEQVLSPTPDVLKVLHFLPSEDNGECGELGGPWDRPADEGGISSDT